MKYAVSACLLGDNCKYNGGNNNHEELHAFLKDKAYIKVCPEVLGGLPVPRACCEIVGNRVMNEQGVDCSEAFEKGALQALAKIREFHADMVLVQPRSPSCGVGMIYDGTFQGKLMKGNGVFVQVLQKAGIPVMHFEEFIVSHNKSTEKESE